MPESILAPAPLRGVIILIPEGSKKRVHRDRLPVAADAERDCMAVKTIRLDAHATG